MLRRPFLLCLMMLPQFAVADGWTTRPDDRALTKDEISNQIVGHTLTFFDGGESVYSENGEYSYTYGEGGTWLGHYTIEGDGVICVTFVTGSRRCDLYVQTSERWALITEDGLRFPIR